MILCKSNIRKRTFLDRIHEKMEDVDLPKYQVYFIHLHQEDRFRFLRVFYLSREADTERAPPNGLPATKKAVEIK